jgi:hypothetical protein
VFLDANVKSSDLNPSALSRVDQRSPISDKTDNQRVNRKLLTVVKRMLAQYKSEVDLIQQICFDDLWWNKCGE